MSIIVTGGAGFIGSNFVLDWLQASREPVIILDKLTYAGNPENFATVRNDPAHQLVQGILVTLNWSAACWQSMLPGHSQFRSRIPRRSLHTRAWRIHSNEHRRHVPAAGSCPRILGRLTGAARGAFRFLHVSTDEVYGSLRQDEPAFTEAHQYQPNSPYSASKAASDHLVRAYHHTYGLPVLTTNCSNNYGPYHFPEKLIPLVIHNALADKPLPIYGNGQQIRIGYTSKIIAVRSVGSSKMGDQERRTTSAAGTKTNLEVVHTLCTLLDELSPRKDGQSYRQQITFVKDRPGHDQRYAIDASRLERELGWRPAETFETGIRKTVLWYLSNQNWVERIINGTYREWISNSIPPDSREFSVPFQNHQYQSIRTKAKNLQHSRSNAVHFNSSRLLFAVTQLHD